MPRRPIHRTRLVVATVASTTLAGALGAHALAAPPATAQEAAPPTEPAAAPEPGGSDPTPMDPPPGAPTTPPAADVPASPPAVRSGYAVDVPGAPATELPVAAPEEAPTPRSDGRSADDPTEDQERGSGEPGTRRGTRASTGDAGSDAPTRGGARTPTTSTAAAPPPPPTEHVVVAGEHLWSIAAAHLATASGRPPGSITPQDVAPYWVRLCLQNEPRLASGDPNLVYPGEVLELPPV